MIKIFILSLLCIIHLSAHKIKENYLTLHFDNTLNTTSINLQVESRLFEINFDIDDNHNEIVSYKELYHHQNRLIQYVQKHFQLMYRNTPLILHDANISFYRNQEQTYMRIEKTFQRLNLDHLVLHYNLFFEYETDHKLLIHLDDLRGDYLIDSDNRTYAFSSYQMKQTERIRIFISQGFYHILDGLDHLLFILLLLLSVNRIAQNKSNKKTTIIFLLKLITTFSVAHSMTLFIAGSGLYIPNSQLIECGIAFSIFVVALLNFYHQYKHVNYIMVFLFGLLHGFGFANVLKLVNIQDMTSFIVSLLGFNFGVELGQILVIALLIPLLYLILKSNYSQKIIQLVSLLSMGIAIFWFMQRIGLFELLKVL